MEFGAFEASLTGAIVGSLFRLAPELLAFASGWLDRRHEERMLRLEMEYAKTGNPVGMRLPNGGSVEELDAILRMHAQQNKMAAKAGHVVEWFNALVRPGVATWLVALYSILKLTVIKTWGPEDYMILTTVLSFYFLNRVYRK